MKRLLSLISLICLSLMGCSTDSDPSITCDNMESEAVIFYGVQRPGLPTYIGGHAFAHSAGLGSIYVTSDCSYYVTADASPLGRSNAISGQLSQDDKSRLIELTTAIRNASGGGGSSGYNMSFGFGFASGCASCNVSSEEVSSLFDETKRILINNGERYSNELAIMSVNHGNTMLPNSFEQHPIVSLDGHTELLDISIETDTFDGLCSNQPSYFTDADLLDVIEQHETKLANGELSPRLHRRLLAKIDGYYIELFYREVFPFDDKTDFGLIPTVPPLSCDYAR